MPRTIKTVPEMAAAMSAEVAGSKRKRALYKSDADSFKKTELAANIAHAIANISSESTRVDFSNINDVRKRIVDYFNACSQAGVYPSVQGLASYGFGISRQALNQWRNRSINRGSEVGNLIDKACDMIADLLVNQSLHNNANPILTIFSLKNSHGFADRVEIEAVPSDVLDNGHVKSDEELRRKYLESTYNLADAEP